MIFYLFSLCKNFIVGPTLFHWWGAWLNQNTNKLCFRPKNLNPSNNGDFWPKKLDIQFNFFKNNKNFNLSYFHFI